MARSHGDGSERPVRGVRGRQVREALGAGGDRISLGWDVVHRRFEREPPDTLDQLGRRWSPSRERMRRIEQRTRQFLQQHLRAMQDAGATPAA